jgi:hypothetical protein
MHVPNTREPQKIPISQVTHEWVQVVRDLRIAKARAEAICGELLPNERC